MIRRACAIVASATVALAAAGCGRGFEAIPACGRTDRSIFVLEAQAVPSATQLPCMASLPVGWQFDSFQVRDGSARFWLGSDRAGVQAVEVELTPACDVTSAVSVEPAPDETAAEVFQQPESLRPQFTATRFLRFDGGCIAYHYAFAPGAASTLVLEADEALGMVPRQEVVDRVRQELGLTLCGAGAPPCAG